MRKSGALRIGLVLLLATLAAGVFAVVGRADDPAFDQRISSLEPGGVNLGQTFLYRAQWHDNDNRTFTHTQVEITVPAGYELVASKPSGCTKSGTLIKCAWGTLHFGDLVAQEVRLKPDALVEDQPITSLLSFYEGTRNPGRQNRLDVPTQFVDVFSQTAEPNKAGGCAGGGEHVKTVPGAGNSETDATAPFTAELCTPITIVEQPRPDPLTDLVTTDAALEPSTTNPIKLKIIFRNTSSHTLFFTSSVGQFEVKQCTDPTASPDACWYDRNFRQQSATWFVDWSGIDPTWTG